MRCIIAKDVLLIVGSDNQCAAGSLQLSGGQTCGVEVAIHSMRPFLMMRNSAC